MMGVFSNRRPHNRVARSDTTCPWARRVRQTLAWGFVLWTLMGVIVTGPAYSIEVPLTGAIPADIHSIELSYVGEHTTPSVTINGPPDSVPSTSDKPISPLLDLLPDFNHSQVFGVCRGRMLRPEGEKTVTMTFAEAGGGRCGQRIELRPNRGVLDLLSYKTIRLRGQAQGLVSFAMEDWASAIRQDNVRFVTVRGTFDVTIPLVELGRSLDLRRAAALVVTTEDSEARVVLEQMDLAQDRSSLAQSGRSGLWVWRYREAIEDPGAILSTCRRHSLSRVMIQMPASEDGPEIWRAYVRLLVTLRESGIEVVALDGYPEAIYEPQQLAEKVRRLFSLVEPHLLAGVQLDIEPYLLPGFLDDETGPIQYLNAIDLIKEMIGQRTHLSVVIPFWLTTVAVRGRPLAFAVMDRVDEVVVMSYRTDLDEVKSLSDDTLRYGDLIGIPVWLAVETITLPVEQRVTLKREPCLHLADAVLDRLHRRLMFPPFSSPLSKDDHREGFRVHHRMTVRPERITFAGRPRSDVEKAVRTLLNTVAHRSFAGIVIHDFDGLRALAE
jgi:hypothetical protein